MEITTEQQVDGEKARTLRKELNLSQSEFWGKVCVNKQRGSRYELGERVPKPIQRLVFLRYVCGIPVDAEPSELHLVGRFAMAHQRALGNLEDAGEAAARALDYIQDASEGLESI